jgi:hypothetical protein
MIRDVVEDCPGLNKGSPGAPLVGTSSSPWAPCFF